MKLGKYTLLLSLFLIVFNSVQSQYYLKTTNDSIPLESDSVKLTIDEYTGTPNWQVSSDLTNWTTLDYFKDTLNVRIDSSSFFRAFVTNGMCYPVISDTVKVVEKITVTDGNQFTIDSTGGIFQLPSGLKIIVPANAIEGITELFIEEFDSIQAKTSLPFPADSDKKFGYAMNFNASDDTLLKPIKVRMPSQKVNRGDLPWIFLFNTETDEWINYTDDILCNLQSEYIELRLNKFRPFRMDVSPEGLLITEEKRTEIKSTLEKNNKAGTDDDCYDIIRIKNRTIDLITIHKGQDCFIIEETGSVEFPRCPDKPKDYWHIRMIGNNCDPEFEVTIDDDPLKEFIKVGNNVELTFFTYINVAGEKMPLPDQFVSFTLPEGLNSENNYNWTNDKGKISFHVMASKENLNAIINCEAHYNYCLDLIEASSTNAFEGACQQPTKIIDKTSSKKVIVYDDCSDPKNIECSSVNYSECQNIKNKLIDHIEFEATDLKVEVGDFRKINFTVYNIEGTTIPEPNMEWSSDNPDIATVDELGIIHGIDIGKTTIHVSWCDEVEVIEVEVIEEEVSEEDDFCNEEDVEVTVVTETLVLCSGGPHSSAAIEIEYEYFTDDENCIPIIEYTSGNALIADVDQYGNVTGKSEGNTTINVSWGDMTQEVELIINCCDSSCLIGSTYPLKMMDYPDPYGNNHIPEVSIKSYQTYTTAFNEIGLMKEVSNRVTEIPGVRYYERRRIPVIAEPDYINELFGYMQPKRVRIY